LTINRNQNNVPVVSAVASLDPSPLSENSEEASAWLSDTRTWEDVYSVRNYEYLEIIVKGGIPVWSSDEKKFVDKASLTSTSTETEELESELTLGVENVKAGIVSAPTASTPVATSTDEEEDDLPF
jgi:hypothetical protein